MRDHRGIGELIRALREAAGLSQRQLARRMGYAQPVLARIEAGTREPTEAQLKALDRAINLGGLLAGDEGGDMHRRAVLALAGLGLGAVGAVLPLTALLEMVERMSMDTPETRWRMVTAYELEYVSADRAPDFGERLFLEVSALRRLTASLPNPTLDHFRDAARLSLIYGLWLAGEGNIPAGHGWCAQAAELATKSRDPETQAHVLGWSAARGVYEKWAISEAVDAAQRTLRLSPGATLGALNAHAALVHVAGLTGQVDSGRRAVWAMHDTAQALGGWVAAARTELFGLYLEARIGDPAAAVQIFDTAEELTRGTAWQLDTMTYGGMAQVRSGNVVEGIRMALDGARTAGVMSHLNRVGLADLLGTVQDVRPGYRSDDLDEVRQLVPVTTPRPWMTARP